VVVPYADFLAMSGQQDNDDEALPYPRCKTCTVV
jgi:hypothetical protein